MATALATTALGAVRPAEVGASTAVVRITGAGFGHGVGMSQYGARGLAVNGWTADRILTHYYTGTNVAPAIAPDGLRVLVGTAGAFTLTAGSTTRVAVEGITGAPALPTLAAGGTAVVQRSTGGITVRIGTATYGPLAAGARVVATPTVCPTCDPVRLTPPNQRFKWGTITFRNHSDGGLRAIVGGLTMEQYLYGLGEVPSSWPAEALKAQAIAGRTYATNIIDGYGSGRATRDFDLYASTVHQAYIGFEKEGGAMGVAWAQAVNATVGRMVLSAGRPINAVYSSSSGGHTEDASYVFVSPVPYLKAVPDPYDAMTGNPVATWTREFEPSRFGGFFGVGTLTNISVSGPVGVSGRIDKATVTLTGTAGTVSMTGARFRQIVNNRVGGAEQIRSTKLSVGVTAPGGGPVVEERPRPPVGFIETTTVTGRRVAVTGWAADANSASPVTVEITLSSPAGVIRRSAVTSIDRPDVAKVIGGTTQRGYNVAVDVPKAGNYKVCLNATDLPGTTMTGITCTNATVK